MTDALPRGRRRPVHVDAAEKAEIEKASQACRHAPWSAAWLEILALRHKHRLPLDVPGDFCLGEREGYDPVSGELICETAVKPRITAQQLRALQERRRAA